MRGKGNGNGLSYLISLIVSQALWPSRLCVGNRTNTNLRTSPISFPGRGGKTVHQEALGCVWGIADTQPHPRRGRVPKLIPPSWYILLMNQGDSWALLTLCSRTCFWMGCWGNAKKQLYVSCLFFQYLKRLLLCLLLCITKMINVSPMRPHVCWGVRCLKR